MDPNECDLDLLQRLRSAQPLWLDGHDDGTVVSWDDLDRDLRETFLTVAPEFEPTRIDGGLYVTAFEWAFAYEDIWRLITTRMRLRSLGLAVAGPTATELERAPLLSSWVPVRSEGANGAHLVGDVDAHPADIGPLIHTSRLCGIDPEAGWARTVSRWYCLGDRSTPTEFYRRWGRRAEGISAIAIEVWEAQAICVEEQVDEGVREP